jgi:hypothetical protein
LWRPFWKWRLVEIFRCQESIRGHNNLLTYEMSLKSDNVELVRHCGGHFENIFKMAIAKIQHCSISKVAFNLFFKPVVSGQFGRLHNR